MKIAIVTDKSREDLIPSEESIKEDEQKDHSVREIYKILSNKYDCILLKLDENIINTLRKEKIDLVFNMCNGLLGDSKLAQFPAMLEAAGIAYTASSPMGHSLASNKFYSSCIFQTNNIPTPKFLPIYNINEIENINIEYPILVKPNDEGSSRGIHQNSLVFNKDDLCNLLKEELKIYNPPILLNQYVDGREFSVGILGNGSETEVLAIQEVDLSDLPNDLLKFYSFEVKSYYKDYTKYHIPPKLSLEEEALIKETAIKAFNSLNLHDYARVDIIMKDNIPYVLEINSLPGLMKGKSSLYRMAESTGLGYENLIFQIVDIAKDRYNL